MYDYLPYILLIVVITFILIYAYIRAKFGFWVLQPVFHIYDIPYYFYKPGIIQHNLPEKNKYTNFKNIETTVTSNLSETKITKIVNFIRINYLRNKENRFLPKRENIIPYFTGHNGLTFFTFYNEELLLYNPKQNDTIQETKIISIMSSRPLHITINNGDKNATFDAYYVDYLCVEKEYRKKGIAPQMIQTHHYNQRHLNKKIAVSLFKREEELTGIIPLCLYSTFGFSVDKWNKPIDFNPVYKLIEVTQHNFHFLYDFIKLNSNQFDILIMCEITNIIELIKTKNIFIYFILNVNTDNISAAYFYRKSCVYVDKNMEVLTLIASICGGNGSHDDSHDLFIQGFKISFWKIAAENNFGFCAIENISDNDIIIENIKIKTTPLIISPTAYFFYNFIYSTFSSKRVFILN